MSTFLSGTVLGVKCHLECKLYCSYSEENLKKSHVKLNLLTHFTMLVQPRLIEWALLGAYSPVPSVPKPHYV